MVVTNFFGCSRKLVGALLFSLLLGSALAEDRSVRIGVVANEHDTSLLRIGRATTGYLTSRIRGASFELAPLNDSTIKTAVSQAEIDFVLAGPALYAQLESLYALSGIATLNRDWGNDGFVRSVGGVVFTTNDRHDVITPDDLRGKRFAAVGETAFGGWLAAWRELAELGIDPQRDLSKLTFAGDPQAVLDTVLNGSADAGTVSTGMLEQLANNGPLDLGRLRIIRFVTNPASIDSETHFPFHSSTRLYPEASFSKLEHTEISLAEEVATALLNVPVAKGFPQWTVPSSYQSVHELLRTLRIAPYSSSTPQPHETTTESNWLWPSITFATLLIMGIVTTYVIKLNRRVSSAKKELERDLLERSRAEKVLRRSEERFRNLVETTNDVAWEMDKDGQYTYVSPQITRLLGYQPEEIVGQRLPPVLQSGNLHANNKDYSNFLERRTAFTGIEVAQHHKDGRCVTIECSGVPYFGQDGELIGYRGINRDITLRKRTEDALYHEKERIQVTLEAIADGVIRADVHGTIEYINPAAAHLTGLQPEAAVGKPLLDVLNIVDETGGEQVKESIQRALDESRNTHLTGTTLLYQENSNNTFNIEMRIAPIHDKQNCVIGTVLVFHDVSEIRRLTRQMAYQASHDALTELLNRREFERRLEKALETAKLKNTSHVMCYLDLDQFKVINDMGGHVAGDELLKQLALKLQAAVRETDILARLGGDEFGVLLLGCHTSKAMEVARNLCKVVKEHRFVWQQKVTQVNVSAGLVPITADSGSLTDVLSAADSACYVAKEQGRNRVHLFEPNDTAVAQRHGQMQWVHRLKSALDENRFRLYCEAFVPLSKSAAATKHYEILIRLIDERGDEVGPTAFIPSAERYHLMPAIDRWVISTTLTMLAEAGSRAIDTNIVFTINLSGQSLSDETFLKFIIDQFDHSGIAPDRICFEITETAAIANLTHAVRLMTILKGMGCRFALDDFGTGVSSFAYLKSLPVDYLKIDGSFVRNIRNDPIDYAMVDTINHIGQLMGLKTIAEYVEEENILRTIEEIGVDYAQGHGIAETFPLSNIINKSADVKAVV